MEIRIFSYSIKIRDFINWVAFIYVTIVLTDKLGFIRFAGLACTIFGAVFTMRCFLFWLMDEGPYIERPARDTMLSFALFLVGLAFLFL
jgi:hypothetical protein